MRSASFESAGSKAGERLSDERSGQACSPSSISNVFVLRSDQRPITSSGFPVTMRTGAFFRARAASTIRALTWASEFLADARNNPEVPAREHISFERAEMILSLDGGAVPSLAFTPGGGIPPCAATPKTWSATSCARRRTEWRPRSSTRTIPHGRGRAIRGLPRRLQGVPWSQVWKSRRWSVRTGFEFDRPRDKPIPRQTVGPAVRGIHGSIAVRPVLHEATCTQSGVGHSLPLL
jgi:hypothetical protein